MGFEKDTLMKTIILLILFSFSCQAQSLYNPKANDKLSYVDSESFSITFTKSLYGLTFEQNDRKLDNELKTKIERFMKNTNRPKFKGQGKFLAEGWCVRKPAPSFDYKGDWKESLRKRP